MKVFSGTSNRPLAEKISRKLGLELSPLEIHLFPDGEKRIQILEPVVDEECIVLQSTGIPVDGNYIELCFIVDALKRSGARLVTAVVPYMGYTRQDHVFRSGEARSFAVIVKMLEAVGCGRVLTLDLHSIKIPELFKIPVEHLSALPLFAEKIRGLLDNVHLGGVAKRHPRGGPMVYPVRNSSGVNIDSVLVSPDMGGIRRIKLLSEMLGGIPFASIVKNRDLATGEIVASEIQGDVKDTAIIVDDMISTGGTIARAVRLLREKGVKEVYVFATHAVFAKDAHVILSKENIEGVFVTDTIDVPKKKQFPKLETLSVADLIAKELFQE